jgi:cysteine desulfurase
MTTYLDNAATTQMHPEVIDAMLQTMRTTYGNASSSHSFGRASKVLVEQARKNIAKQFNVSAAEIVFTSGGTEADNLALRSAVRDCGVERIVTSKVEHHAVLHTVTQLQKEYGIVVEFVDIEPSGHIDYKHLENLLKDDKKTLVSLMHINNEIGTLLDIKRVGEICKTHNALFHSDCVQSIGHFKLDLQEIKIDFLAASAHKFHGPKGVGFAFVRKNSGLQPLIFGGEQERGYRAGTEAVHNIIGLETAVLMAYSNLDKERSYIEGLKSYFISQLEQHIENVAFNGSSSNLNESTYTLLSVRLPVSAEKAGLLLFQLDLKGIACSKGSACQSGSVMGSHVLFEVLNEDTLQKPSLRFSFSKYNTKEELDYVVSVLKEFISA